MTPRSDMHASFGRGLLPHDGLALGDSSLNLMKTLFS